ncbi:NADP-dependent oxidoreductase [Trebonia sp.]|uniref:NADP-dependent oxidoreductase n=1 Tax=Trebonia sp. TaxID=2767075 RepID=UPI00262B939E|nr:NADP-dependent oxidoreductase [Trebonia sp.]
MRAIRQEVLGGPEVLHDVEVARPEPGLSQILVRVHAAGLNPTDWKHRAHSVFLGPPPFTLGWDVSGVVEATGYGVTIVKPGDEVFGMLPYPHGVGSHAEYVTGPARAFALKPASLDHVQAGALPLAGLTAWQALADTAHVSAGQRVLIHAAAGGVGHLAVQIAKARGAYVIGTASAGHHELVRGLGADEMIDYHVTDFATAVGDIDVVLDPISGDYSARSLRTLRPGGVLVSLLPFAPDIPAEAARLGVRAQGMLVEYDHGGMTAIADLVTAGQLRPVIAAAFPMADAAKAHELGDTGHVAGKLVLTMA